MGVFRWVRQREGVRQARERSYCFGFLVVVTLPKPFAPGIGVAGLRQRWGMA